MAAGEARFYAVQRSTDLTPWFLVSTSHTSCVSGRKATEPANAAECHAKASHVSERQQGDQARYPTTMMATDRASLLRNTDSEVGCMYLVVPHKTPN
jgi:hypothetical protein